MFHIPRGSSSRLRRATTACTSVAIVLVATTSIAATGSQAATAHAASKCRTVVKATPWAIHGSGSGNTYTLVAAGMSCSAATRWVLTFTQEVGRGLGKTLQGPSGYRCESASEAASGDNHVYAGLCGQPPHNVAFFDWAPAK
jgi:hypothetical protein